MKVGAAVGKNVATANKTRFSLCGSFFYVFFLQTLHNLCWKRMNEQAAKRSQKTEGGKLVSIFGYEQHQQRRRRREHERKL